MNGNSKGGYSLKTNNSGGTPGGTSRVHKIDSLTPYQNRYNKKNYLKWNMYMYCNYNTTTYVTFICMYVDHQNSLCCLTLICQHKSEYQTQKFNNKNYKLLKF